MEPKVELSAAAIAELKLGGIVLERREMILEYLMNCLRLKMPDEEIRPTLVDYIKNKGWPWVELDARFGLLAVAKARLWGDRPPVPEPVPEEMVGTCLADVAPEPVRWLWPRYIPVGKVTVVYGDAGVGKTCWALNLAARVSAGLNWPFASYKPVPPAAV
ncbi:MAG: ATPase, partial [Planctomycetaceae bacterium]|nr:ATPase [Planctomycetaceae bacterium]